jgi:hypothetical protein
MKNVTTSIIIILFFLIGCSDPVSVDNFEKNSKDKITVVGDTVFVFIDNNNIIEIKDLHTVFMTISVKFENSNFKYLNLYGKLENKFIKYSTVNSNIKNNYSVFNWKLYRAGIDIGKVEYIITGSNDLEITNETHLFSIVYYSKLY